jgi:hypothetical protein
LTLNQAIVLLQQMVGISVTRLFCFGNVFLFFKFYIVMLTGLTRY